MHQREGELVWAADKLFPVPAKDFGNYSVLDASHTFERSFKWDATAPEPTATDPWRTSVPTLTANSKIIVRVRDNATGTVCMRRLHGLEAFALQGWGLGQWQSKNPVSDGSPM